MARASKTSNRTRKAKAGKRRSLHKGRKAAQTKRRTASSNTRHEVVSVAALRRQLERLSMEIDQALERQAATADVLRLISRPTVELKTVLDTLLETAARLCRAEQAIMFRQRDDGCHLVAVHGYSEEAEKFVASHPLPLDRGSLAGRVVSARRAIHIPDVLQDPEYTYKEGQKIAGNRTMLGIPLLRGDELIGVFSINRTRVEPYTNEEIELATTFADQAVIAIENARLFDEVQAKTHDLEVALLQQTATADVLKVISRSAFDLQTVLRTLVESAAKLCNAGIANIRMRDGDVLRAQAWVGASEDIVEYIRSHAIRRGRRHVIGRAFLTGELV